MKFEQNKLWLFQFARDDVKVASVRCAAPTLYAACGVMAGFLQVPMPFGDATRPRRPAPGVVASYMGATPIQGTRPVSWVMRDERQFSMDDDGGVHEIGRVWGHA